MISEATLIPLGAVLIVAGLVWRLARLVERLDSRIAREDELRSLLDARVARLESAGHRYGRRLDD